MILTALALSTLFAGSGRTLPETATSALEAAAVLAPDFEAGGAIYRCGDVYAYPAPTTDGKRDRVNVNVYVIEGCDLVAIYHTHPKGDARFSKADVAGICSKRLVGFIKPRGGAPRVFDCSNLSYAAVQIALSGERPIYGAVL